MAKSTSPVRASGRAAEDEAAAEEMKTLTPVQPDEEGLHKGLGLGLTGGAVSRSEDKGMSMTPAFSRMRTDWHGPDADVMRQMHRGVETLIQNAFGDLFDILYEVYAIVREPDVDESTGEIRTDAFGVPEWKKAPGTNSYFEDWTRLGHRERENLIFKLTTGVFRWSQKRDEMWAEAMFARAQFEEAFARGYKALPGDKPTIDDRTAHARQLSAEYRYHSVYASALSKRADSIVRFAELLGQRLKDLSQ